MVVGTKCNHLLCLDVATGQSAEIALPVARTQPPAREDPGLLPSLVAHPHGSCGIHAISMSPDRRLMATGGNDPAQCQVFEVDLPGGRGIQATFRPVQTLVVSA